MAMYMIPLAARSVAVGVSAARQTYMVTKVAKMTSVFNNLHVLFPAPGSTQLMQAVAALDCRCPGSW